MAREGGWAAADLECEFEVEPCGRGGRGQGVHEEKERTGGHGPMAWRSGGYHVA